MKKPFIVRKQVQDNGLIVITMKHPPVFLACSEENILSRLLWAVDCMLKACIKYKWACEMDFWKHTEEDFINPVFQFEMVLD